MFDPKTLLTSTTDRALDQLVELLNQFIDAPLVPYATPDQAVEALASRARAINIALVDVGEAAAGAWLSGLRDDFNALLYKNGQPFTWSRFVDSYVQIAVFGTLLWRLETGKDISLGNVVALDANPSPTPLPMHGRPLEACRSAAFADSVIGGVVHHSQSDPARHFYAEGFLIQVRSRSDHQCVRTISAVYDTTTPKRMVSTTPLRKLLNRLLMESSLFSGHHSPIRTVFCQRNSAISRSSCRNRYLLAGAHQ